MSLPSASFFNGRETIQTHMQEEGYYDYVILVFSLFFLYMKRTSFSVWLMRRKRGAGMDFSRVSRFLFMIFFFLLISSNL